MIVVSGASCVSVTDYGSSYPDPQPLPIINNKTYIAGGWNDTLLIPDEFTAGEGVSTVATRLGKEETYNNPELNEGSTYCLLLIVYLESGIQNVRDLTLLVS